ncbi:hypothetical protein B566_EDAN010773 [Ephemera danica]|nr:hypothetical protein B566_EDAN010773 [Ephemera danica]
MLFSGKRLREESPEKAASKHTKKRICCNEIEGSLSSSRNLVNLKKRPEPTDVEPTDNTPNPAASLTSTMTLTSATTLPVVSIAQQNTGEKSLPIVATMLKTSEPLPAPEASSLAKSDNNGEQNSSEKPALQLGSAGNVAPTNNLPVHISFATTRSTDAPQATLSTPASTETYPSTTLAAFTSGSTSMMVNTNVISNVKLMEATDKDQSLSLNFINQFESKLNPNFGNFAESQSSSAPLQPLTSSAFVGNTGLASSTVQPIGFQPTQSPNVFATPRSQEMSTASALTSSTSVFTSTAPATTSTFGNVPLQFFGTPTSTSSTPNPPTFASSAPMFGTGSIGNTTSGSSAFAATPFGTATAGIQAMATNSPGAFDKFPSSSSMFDSDSMVGTSSSSSPSVNPQAAAASPKNVTFGSLPPPNPFSPATPSMATPNPFQQNQTPPSFAAKPAVGGFSFGNVNSPGQSTPTSSGNVNQSTGIANKPTSTGMQGNIFGAPPNQSPFQQQMPSSTSSSSSTFGAKPPGGFSFALGANNNNNPFATSQPAATTTSAPSITFPPFAFGQSKPIENPSFSFHLPAPKSNTAQPFSFGIVASNNKQPQQAAFGFGNTPQQQQQQQQQHHQQQQQHHHQQLQQHQQQHHHQQQQQHRHLQQQQHHHQQQRQRQQQQQQSAPFGTNNTFAFGQAPAQPSTSQFQFGAGAPMNNPVPPGPSAAGGMFSIGAGAAPPSRRALARRRKPIQ